MTYPSTKIEVFRPAIGEEEIDAVAAVMRSGWIGRGPNVEEFELAWAKYLGVDSARVVSLSCATEALYQVFAWLGLAKPGATVVMPAISYIGTANAVRAAGLKVRLCDVDPRTLNPTYRHIQDALDESTTAVVIQHYGGVPSDQEWIEALVSEREDLYLVEDCACAPASMFYGGISGVDCDFGIWSFDAMKVLTAGDGGLLYCREQIIADDIRRDTLLGLDSASGQAGRAERWWEFNVEAPARRAIMNDIQAAIGLAQIPKLLALVESRKQLWDDYQLELSSLTWLSCPPEPPAGVRSSYYTYWIQVMKPEWRDRLAVFLRERGIYTTFRYWPVHRAYGLNVLDCPGADWAADHTLNLPLHPGLTEDDVNLVVETIAEFGRTL